MILLDRRIGSSDLFLPLRALGIEVELTTLDAADAAWLGRGPDESPVPIGVEIKRVGDLLSSIRDGRLSGAQLPKLIREYSHRWLLIEGRYRSGDEGLLETRHGSNWLPTAAGRRPVTFREIESFLTTLELKGGIHIRRSWDRQDTAAVVAALYHWWTGKVWDEHRAHIALHSPMADAGLLYRPSLKRRIAAELPGVGVEKSGRVADHFPSVKAMIDAEVQEWQTIPGIGKTLATRIRTALSE